MTDKSTRTRRIPRQIKTVEGEESPQAHAKFDPRKLKKGKPGDDPIAVIGPDGHILPFTNNMVDRFYLMHSKVTYVYDLDDLRAMVKINNAAIEADRDDRIVFGSPLQPKAREPLDAHTVSEVVAQAYSPSMLETG